MRVSKEKSEFIKVLRERPFISYAAKKVGISRSTIYRWMKDNYDFRDKVNDALKEGRKILGDVAEIALMKQVESGNLRAIMFFLTHNNRIYTPKRSLYIEPKELKPGEACETCGHEMFSPVPKEDLAKMIKDAAISLGLIKYEPE